MPCRARSSQARLWCVHCGHTGFLIAGGATSSNDWGRRVQEDGVVGGRVHASSREKDQREDYDDCNRGEQFIVVRITAHEDHP